MSGAERPEEHGRAQRDERRPASHRLRRTLARLALVLVLLGAGGFAWLWFAPCGLGGCAPVSDLQRFQAEGSQLFDIDGEPFGILATVNRRIVPLDSLPAYLPEAFLAVEDRRFYQHHGVDWRRMFGALATNVRKGGVAEGGSTISMQLARNLFPEHLPYRERSIRRKFMEIRVARQIERKFSKDKILELYLNHIYLGSGAYGVEAAAREYFGKSAAELTLSEAATLGGLPVAPSTLDPSRNRDGARERRDVVLREMAEAHYITPEQASEAREQPLKLARAKETGTVRAGYFIERVRRELEERVGDRFYTAGLKVYTTLDPVAQGAAERELIRQLDAIEGGSYGAFRHTTYAKGKGVAAETGETPYLQGMVVMMDAASGEVRALVGGRDYADSKFDRAVQALRQPGSAFKPFVYLAALERYRSPVYRVEDAPVTVALTGGRSWQPRNYTGTYDGMLTLREALARSKNAATVRLAQEVGMSTIIREARDLGITSDIPDLPSTALGAAAVRPIELVTAYAALANGGTLVEPYFVRRIEDRHGAVLWEASPQTQRALDPAVAFVMTSMLRDVVDRGTGTAVRAAGFRAPAAGKTGTTNGATDAWFVGYTPELVAGVWIGLDQPRTIVRGASGGTLAAPVWARVMAKVYAQRRSPPDWSPPAGVTTAQVERGTGIVADEWCHPQGPVYTEYFIGAPPRTPCQGGAYGAPVLASGDSWIDEEWADENDLDTYGDTTGGASGIYWPELEAMRDSAGTSAASAVSDSQRAERIERGATIDMTALERLRARDSAEQRGRDSTRVERGRDGAAPPTVRDSVVPDTTRPPPRVLGRPVGEGHREE